MCIAFTYKELIEGVNFQFYQRVVFMLLHDDPAPLRARASATGCRLVPGVLDRLAGYRQRRPGGEANAQTIL